MHLSRISISFLILALVASGCADRSAREYPVTGQILAVNADQGEVTIKHQDIPGFMPGMTMTFSVRDRGLLAERAPGDLVNATLVVDDTDYFLSRLERIGHAPVPQTDSAGPSRMLSPGEAVEDVTLTDQTGARRQFSELRGDVAVVTFTYTRCPLPDFCPAMDRKFSSVQEAIAGDPALAGTKLVSVTIDPDYDSPAVLRKHAEALKADPAVWRFLTGSQQEVDALASQFGLSIIRNSPEDIVHNLRTAVVDPQGRVAAMLGGADWKVADLIAEVKKARLAQ